MRRESKKLCRVFSDRDVWEQIGARGYINDLIKVRSRKAETIHIVVPVDTEPSARIEGYVWDARTGMPLANAEVYATLMTEMGARIVEKRGGTFTDELGHYVIKTWGDGPVKVSAGYLFKAPGKRFGLEYAAIWYEDKVLKKGGYCIWISPLAPKLVIGQVHQ